MGITKTQNLRSFLTLGIIAGLLLIARPSLVVAAACSANPNQQSCSGTYGVSETFFGTGGELHACSTTYCSKQAAGETTVGATGSNAYKAQAGFNTDRVPSLTFIVNTTNINLGTLTAGTTKTATSTFSVSSYLSNGYTVQTVGAAPSNGSRSISNMATTAASNATLEQFGMNLRANTSPATFGADPAQVPDTTFGFGAPAPAYSTINQYRYNNGDTIAQSTTSSGETDFTISYILNTTNLTPGGTYTMKQVLVATATF